MCACFARRAAWVKPQRVFPNRLLNKGVCLGLGAGTASPDPTARARLHYARTGPVIANILHASWGPRRGLERGGGHQRVARRGAPRGWLVFTFLVAGGLVPPHTPPPPRAPHPSGVGGVPRPCCSPPLLSFPLQVAALFSVVWRLKVLVSTTVPSCKGE